MVSKRQASIRIFLLTSALIGAAASATAAAAQGVPIIQPGAPGQPVRPLTAQQASQIANTRFSPDDVRFMADMIHHHHQAMEMAALVDGRTTRKEVVDVAKRIDASQEDEIKFMQGWLRDRGQNAPDPAGHAGHEMPGQSTMPGMSSPQQMAALAAAKGAQLDRLFLERMIAHHEGAVKMGRDLLRKPGSAHDPVLYDFVNELINEQQAEIKRMSELVVRYSEDPRSALAAGFRNAGQAASNMRLVASLPKPPGFFDPSNPEGRPLPNPKKKETAADRKKAAEDDSRSPHLSFSNTDMAFSGDLLAVGNYHGFNLYRLDRSGVPKLTSSVICPGGQGDLSIVGDLLIMSVEQTRGRLDCGRQGVAQDVSPERFRGIRIFNIRDRLAPVQVGAVQTCRGSHTHSVVSERGGSIIVYNSGTAGVRKGAELPGCVGDVAGDPRTALFRIDVIEIPVADPSRARIIDSPAVFADRNTIAGLWQGGAHGEGTQETSATDQCHDITTFPTRSLAAGACSGNGIIFDIADPRKPRRIDAVTDPGFAYWHSATFNNEGTKVLFTDEWGGGGRPRCRAQDPRNWGANAIYDIVGGKLRFRSHYKLPSAQTDNENCVAHNGSIVPVPGRDIFVQAWYQGGISVLDFTDSASPREIAYFDRGPISAERMAMGGFWSAYWYGGKIYGTEIARGLDVFALTPSEHLTANEIAAASLASYGGRFNPQQQLPVTWPAHPVVALAYLDQLQRSQGLTPALSAALRQELEQARPLVDSGRRDSQLAARIAGLARSLEANGRAVALKRAVEEIAARVR
jgi:uncharacterized protein (DUF305 family)